MPKKHELTDMDVDLAPMLMKHGSNAAIVAHVIETRKIAAHADINDPDSLMLCLQKYLFLCAEQNMKITNLAAYAACGVSSTDLANWESGRTRANDKRYREFALLIKSICSQYREQAMVENVINVAVGIWHQKIHDGYREDSPVAVEADTGLEIKQDPEEIAARYQGLLEVHEDEDNT